MSFISGIKPYGLQKCDEFKKFVQQHKKELAVGSLLLGAVGISTYLWKQSKVDGGYRVESLLNRLFGRVIFPLRKSEHKTELEGVIDASSIDSTLPTHSQVSALAQKYSTPENQNWGKIDEQADIPYIPSCSIDPHAGEGMASDLQQWLLTLPHHLGQFFFESLLKGNCDGFMREALNRVLPFSALGQASRIVLLAYLTRKGNQYLQRVLEDRLPLFKRYSLYAELLVLVGTIGKLEMGFGVGNGLKIHMGEGTDSLQVYDLEQECWDQHSLAPVRNPKETLQDLAGTFLEWLDKKGRSQAVTCGMLLKYSQKLQQQLVSAVVQHWNTDRYGQRPRVLQVDALTFESYLFFGGEEGLKAGLKNFCAGIHGNRSIVYLKNIEQCPNDIAKVLLKTFSLEAARGKFFLLLGCQEPSGDFAEAIKKNQQVQELQFRQADEPELESGIRDLLKEMGERRLLRFEDGVEEFIVGCLKNHSLPMGEWEGNFCPYQETEEVLKAFESKKMDRSRRQDPETRNRWESLRVQNGLYRKELRLAKLSKNEALLSRYRNLLYFGEMLEAGLFRTLTKERLVKNEDLKVFVRERYEHLFTGPSEADKERFSNSFEALRSEFPGYENVIDLLQSGLGSWYGKMDHAKGQPPRYFFFGPSRTGKTQLAKRLGQELPKALGVVGPDASQDELDNCFAEMNCNELGGERVLQILASKISERQGKLLIIRLDEVEKVQYSEFVNIFSTLLNVLSEQWKPTGLEEEHYGPYQVGRKPKVQKDLNMSQVIFLFTSNLAADSEPLGIGNRDTSNALLKDLFEKVNPGFRSGGSRPSIDPTPFIRRFGLDQLIPMWFPKGGSPGLNRLFQNKLREVVAESWPKVTVEFGDKEFSLLHQENPPKDFQELREFCQQVVEGLNCHQNGEHTLKFPEDFPATKKIDR